MHIPLINYDYILIIMLQFDYFDNDTSLMINLKLCIEPRL